MRIAPIVATAALFLATAPASAGAVRDVKMEMLAERLFPLFGALASQPERQAALIARSEIAALIAARQAARAACGDDLSCIARAALWSQADATVLTRALAATPGLSTPGDDAAAQAEREIAGINAIVRTYALGQLPPYPEIDGAGMLDPQEANARLQAAVWLARAPRAGSLAALDPSVELALALLDAHDRTDAIGFEPIDRGPNAPAMERARTLDWSAYRYPAMIVTGVGPETPDMPISAFGKYHLRLAAERFARGDVGVIILTGGRAHPRATRFAEAKEMRDALIERYKVPAAAIVIEPYARHTTTNLRNATRLMMAMGAPIDRDALIVCNPGQSEYIASARFTARNQQELGYQPGRIGRRLSPTELAFRPSPQSVRIDPRDPLDP
ncbi:YdcF family protein [Sphingomonas sp. IW22]